MDFGYQTYSNSPSISTVLNIGLACLTVLDCKRARVMG